MTVHLVSCLSIIILLVIVFHAAAEPEAGDCCRRCLDSVWFAPPASPVRLARGIYCSLRIVAVFRHTGVDGACSGKWEMSAMIIQKTQPAVKAPAGGVVRMIQHVMPGSSLTAHSSACVFSSFSARSKLRLLSFDGQMRHRGEYNGSTAFCASGYTLQSPFDVIFRV